MLRRKNPILCIEENFHSGASWRSFDRKNGCFRLKIIGKNGLEVKNYSYKLAKNDHIV